jgi:glycosyltransferase involved in cell wall biosynthesis
LTNFNPLISIIIPTYNRANLTREALQSINSQTYGNWEAIIVDDGSTDDSFDSLKEYVKGNEKMKLSQRVITPKGAPACRNIGLKKAKGELIMFLDSDDLMATDCLEKRVNAFAENMGEDILVFQSLLFEHETNDLNILWNIDSEESDLQRFLRIDALWPICGPIYKKKVLQQLKGFSQDLNFWQDFDLHLRFIMLGYKYRKLLRTPPDCFIRQHTNKSISRSIPFTSDPGILQQRVHFFFRQLEFVRDNHIVLGEKERKTVQSVLYYFCTAFLFEHKDKKTFRKTWAKSRKLLKANYILHTVSVVYAFLVYYQRKYGHFRLIRYGYFTMFKNLMPDLTITSKSTMFKISL